MNAPVFGLMTERVDRLTYALPGVAGHPSIMVSASSLEPQIMNEQNIRSALALYQRLEPDAYTEYLSGFCREGLERFGPGWRYADIVTVLIGLCGALEPRSYLEIGVRRGRSACAVASAAPQADLVLLDKWVSGYAGMENPGPDLVRSELDKIGHRGAARFIEGDSHRTLKAYFAENPSAAFDLITVDGDHSLEGAREDLCDALPRLKIGGAVVLDDIAHPSHPYLRALWRELIENDARFSSWSFDGCGFGVAFALRRF